ncbi:NAD(P)-binding domain-containing protein [Propionibacteriaceae bacterium G57]|uniref:NAD(P)-binding domain-containing protein n=1 Tax=Aestuariimicrobium sp. G57 TaxID=3418485 RepID=UPI003DA73147
MNAQPIWDSIVLGAGQAGLSASFHLQRRGINHLVLDADSRPGGAWQHRWDSLTMADVHGVAALPDSLSPEHDPSLAHLPANEAVPAYFARYERDHALPVLRPVTVHRVEAADARPDGLLRVVGSTPAGEQAWLTRTIVNATGTWRQPHLPHYPGMDEFRGEQFHTVSWPGAEHFRGKRTLVVGGGASAVQFLGEIGPITDVLWTTRRPPVWRTDEFTPEAGRAAVALVEQRVRQGLPPRSVVSVTGLMLRPQEEQARLLGVYDRRLPMFARVLPDGVAWADGHIERVDAIVWATGFRSVIRHLAPLGLRSPQGGIQLDEAGTTALADPRVQLVGYGPSASTIGANRAGRAAATGVARRLRQPGLRQTAPN